jgi:hypothetical protein
MTNPLQKHKECTGLRAKAYAFLVGGPLSSVFLPTVLFKKPDERQANGNGSVCRQD